MVEACCPYPSCRRSFAVDETQLGRGVTCPCCGRPLTAREGAIWEVLEARQAEVRGEVRGRPARTEARLSRAVARAEAGWSEQSVEPREAPCEGLTVALDGLRSAANVGAVFRTADGAGFARVHVTGISPLPTNRLVQRVSLGAEQYVPWDYHARIVELLEQRIAEGFEPVALEQTPDAVPLQDFALPARLLLVVGHEVSGVSAEALAFCRRRVCIPMAGRKVSLNASVAFGVAAFALRWRIPSG
ncbi:MAG: hypothetical protein IT371_22645 [Deltaproteobacteria bacterium]|nr:hypothetical protein [Deltaproteobacteria bacterium]